MIVEDFERQVLVHPLADVEGRHHVQDQPGDHAEGAEVDHGAGEGLIAAGELDQIALRGDQRQGGDGRGQVWLAAPEPCVAVAQAPATEMCGSEARLRSAKPWVSRRAATWA